MLASKSIGGPAINAKPVSEVGLIWRNKIWLEGKMLFKMSNYEAAFAKYEIEKFQKTGRKPEEVYTGQFEVEPISMCMYLDVCVSYCKVGQP